MGRMAFFLTEQRLYLKDQASQLWFSLTVSFLVDNLDLPNGDSQVRL